MAITTYSELQTAIAGWLKRTNLTARIPDFITLAEASFNRQLRVRQMASLYTRTTDQNQITLPDDFLVAEKLELDGRHLTYVDRWRVSSADLAHAGHNRNQYTIIGRRVWLLTQVSDRSTFRLHYYQRITLLTDAEPTNWLLEDGPDAYLYGALLQAEPYLKNDARVNIWAQLYSAIIQAMMDANQQARTEGSALVQRAG